MNLLPATTPAHYLTGQAALNVPGDNDQFADWHFAEVFLSGRGRFPVAGVDALDTSDLLGSYGIRECAQVLRRYGLAIDPQHKVYAANHVRAALDLILASITKGYVPSHITLDDTLDDEDSLRDFRLQMDGLKLRISSPTTLSLLAQWEAQQH